MPSSYANLTDALLIGDGNIDDIRADDLVLDAPLLASLPVKASSYETTHEYIKRTGAPAVGFRAMNAGLNNSTSTREKVTELLKYLDASFSLDVGVYDNPSGAQLWTDEAINHLQAALAEAEKQLIYGTGNLADGFNGLANLPLLDNSDDAMVVDAGGTGAALTSVFLIRGTTADVSITAPNARVNLEIAEPFDAIEQDATGKPFNVKRTKIAGWMGLQTGGNLSIVRIANIDTTPGSANGLTDKLITQALLKQKTRRATHLAMNFEAIASLQDSRTATNATGREAEIPVDVHGVSIVATPNITTGETALVPFV